MSRHYQIPKKPSPQYIEDCRWLKAFRDCGWSGMRAIQAANAAIGIAAIPQPKKKRPN